MKIDNIRSDIGDMVTISGPDRERHKEIADLRAVSTDMKTIYTSGCCSTDSEAIEKK